jgi:hypothetical protein
MVCGGFGVRQLRQEPGCLESTVTSLPVQYEPKPFSDDEPGGPAARHFVGAAQRHLNAATDAIDKEDFSPVTIDVSKNICIERSALSIAALLIFKLLLVIFRRHFHSPATHR